MIENEPPAPARRAISDLALVAGYVAHVQSLHRATNPYTLLNSGRIDRYARHAGLAPTERERLIAALDTLAASVA